MQDGSVFWVGETNRLEGDHRGHTRLQHTVVNSPNLNSSDSTCFFIVVRFRERREVRRRKGCGMRRGCFGADREKNVEKKRDSENLRCWVKRKKSKRDKRGMVDNVGCSSEKDRRAHV